MADVALIESQIRSIETSIAVARQQLAQARKDGDTVRVEELNAAIAELNQSLAIARVQLQEARVQTPTVSSGAVVASAATARDDGAYTTNPPNSSATVIVVPESRINQAVEVGTNEPVRTLTTTQATPPAEKIEYQNPVTASGSTPAAPTTQNSGGAGARGDDSPAPNTTSAQTVINVSFGTPENARITSQPNVLNQYASYTYAISWYLLTPDQYNDILNTKQINCSQWQLLMQSGGAPSQSTAGVASRNQYFQYDYYMDDLEIETMIPLKGTGMCHSATSIRFKVVEPNGLTLVNNLYQAVDDLYKSVNSTSSTTLTNANYPMAQYCLAVRFYGYDQNGAISPIKGQTKTTDPLAVVEKFYPFVIGNLRFAMANRAIEYEIKGQPIGHFYNFGTDRGVIPYQFQLIGETVGDILQGKPVGTKYSVPTDGRLDSPQPDNASLSPAPATSEQLLIGESTSPFQVGA